MKALRTSRKILNESLDPKLINSFALHLYLYEKDLVVAAKNVFPINNAMLYGVN